MKLLSILVSFLLLPWMESYNILVAFPHRGKTQFAAFFSLFEALARKGHKISVISHFPSNEAIPNYRDIPIDSTENFAFELIDSSSVIKIMQYVLPIILADIGHSSCESALNSSSVKSFLEENHHFDLAIVAHFNTDCFLTVAKKLNVPVIRTLSCSLLPWSHYRYGSPSNPAYIPHNFAPFSNKLSFFERVENTVITCFHSAYYNNFGVRNDRRTSMKFFGEYGASLDTDILNDSLLLMNTHFSVQFPIPLVPNIVEVGGIHLGVPKPLSKVRSE